MLKISLPFPVSTCPPIFIYVFRDFVEKLWRNYDHIDIRFF